METEIDKLIDDLQKQFPKFNEVKEAISKSKEANESLNYILGKQTYSPKRPTETKPTAIYEPEKKNGLLADKYKDDKEKFQGSDRFKHKDISERDQPTKGKNIEDPITKQYGFNQKEELDYLKRKADIEAITAKYQKTGVGGNKSPYTYGSSGMPSEKYKPQYK